MSTNSPKRGEEEGERIIRKRFSHELRLAYENGNIVELKAPKEGCQGS